MPPLTLDRKQFLQGAGAALLGSTLPAQASAQARPAAREAKAPRAITMWDFSWLERRWPGAGYEDWDRALDELAERGYDAVRIDAYPHLVAQGPTTEWTLKPEWNTQVWGSPALTRVTVLPALFEFLEKCRDRDIKVALSSWFREDLTNVRMTVNGPDRLAEIWTMTLGRIRTAGLLDTVLFVDLCNEWPGPAWAPFVQPPLDWGNWHIPRSMAYMKQAIAAVRKAFPELPLTFSTDSDRVEIYAETDIGFFDLVEHHEWMVRANGTEFYNRTGYNYERFSPIGYDNLQLTAEKVYREKPAYWNRLLVEKIDRVAAAGRRARQPLVTTECWAIVDYKDWPLLPWDWVKDVCAVGTLRASASGQWAAIATSNFCGPQFVGMWRDVAWHRRLTGAIRGGRLDESIRQTRLYARL